MEHAKHIIRAVLLVILIAVTFVVGRHFAIPDTYGEHGNYRFASVAEIAGRNPVHAGRESCVECHDDEASYVSEGSHRSISCEVCHAPLPAHVVEGERVAEMPMRRTYELCAWCHQRLVSRPATFPQVVFSDHVFDKGGELVPSICLECHDAHNPAE